MEDDYPQVQQAICRKGTKRPASCGSLDRETSKRRCQKKGEENEVTAGEEGMEFASESDRYPAHDCVFR